MNLRLVPALLLAPLAPLSTASAQSINIDFGTPGTAPSPGYAAAGRAGAWNRFGVVPGTPQPLIGLWGQSVAATLYNSGGTDLLSFNDPLTSGDDEALMDDMFITFDGGSDLCLYFDNLHNGNYQVIIYGMNPDNSGGNLTRVDGGSPGPTTIGGAWAGHHVQGVTYSLFNITVTSGSIYAHAGIAGSGMRMGMNGIQLVYLGECYANCDGSTAAPILNVNDFACFINRFAAADPLANCDHSTTPPVLNVNDFICYTSQFAAGCP
jgi:hypothetical protein